MKKIAIVGAGPMGLYLLQALLERGLPLSIAIFEKGPQAGVGMPYACEDNHRWMLANIASIEIPPLTCSYIDWLRGRGDAQLERFGVDRTALHERQFLPRILLGEYFREQFLALLEQASSRAIAVDVRVSCEVTDIEADVDGVRLWADGKPLAHRFDTVMLATGHVWPADVEAGRHFFPSPWSGLMEARIQAGRIGVLGTSLSAIDAVMAVAAQHGRFVAADRGGLRFERQPASTSLGITMMSRSGLLPEADFYVPIPYEPLQVATPEAIGRARAAGSSGLLDRLFALVRDELLQADPHWSRRVGLKGLDADSFAAAYFAQRDRHDPFIWARHNLAEVERDHLRQYAVPWRYAILRLHEAVQQAVPGLDAKDHTRFLQGLGKVFVDNYAAVPPESIRRLLALHEAGVVEVRRLGRDYRIDVGERRTVIGVEGEEHVYDVFIDARGQRPMRTADLPFPRLRRQLETSGEVFPAVDEDYSLAASVPVCAAIACGALPYLMHDQPFVQGITAVARIAGAMARLPWRREGGRRRGRLEPDLD